MKHIYLFASLFISACAYSQVSNGLVAKYSFNNGTAEDEVGLNDGTVNGASLTNDRFGNSNMAYEFDGISDYINLGSSATIKPSIGSISLWAKVIAPSNSGIGYPYNPIFVSKNGNTESFFEGCALYYNKNTGNLVAVASEPTTYTEIYNISNNPAVLGDWTHYVITYDDDSLKLYINNVLDFKIPKGFQSVFGNTDPVLLGASNDAVNNRYFNGAIDDIQIFDRVLTANEVALLFNAANPMLTVAENTSSSIAIYPNPANESLSIQNMEPCNYELRDLAGQLLISFSGMEHQTTIDVAHLQPGSYFIISDKGAVSRFTKL